MAHQQTSSGFEPESLWVAGGFARGLSCNQAACAAERIGYGYCKQRRVPGRASRCRVRYARLDVIRGRRVRRAGQGQRQHRAQDQVGQGTRHREHLHPVQPDQYHPGRARHLDRRLEEPDLPWGRAPQHGYRYRAGHALQAHGGQAHTARLKVRRRGSRRSGGRTPAR